MANTFCNHNDENLRKEAQKYLDSGECKTIDEAFETAWADIEYEKWCQENAVREEHDYYA